MLCSVHDTAIAVMIPQWLKFLPLGLLKAGAVSQSWVGVGTCSPTFPCKTIESGGF